jgi:hypothetical protein
LTTPEFQTAIVDPESAPLRLFKEQLENESKKLADAHGLVERGHNLIWWYFTALRRYGAEKIEEIFSDGGGDLGIDALDIDDDDHVHFYQFKNPVALEKQTFEGGDIDKVLAGLNLILTRKHDSVANPELKARIDEIYQTIPNGYTLHVVISSISDLSKESREKLDALSSSLSGIFQYTFEDLRWLWDAFYTAHLPTLEQPIHLALEQTPYPVKSSDHESYVFHLSGLTLAGLYNSHGERLLQQNIRVSAGDNATNKAIESTCTSEQSGKFFHFNNGVTFLCDTAVFDPFTKKLELRKAQVVNGGQTIRVLAKAASEKRLKDDVLTLVRVITSSGDKEFANDVAVNLNNQTRVESSFLKSNDPKIVQLSNSLATLGWYLERREGELGQLLDPERKKLEARLGSDFEKRVIPLKEGAQAYVCTFLREPELAKKNARKIFVDKVDGGAFEAVFDGNLTAQKFILAFQLKLTIDGFVDEFGKRKRRKGKVGNWLDEYKDVLGDYLVDQHHDVVDQVVPQCAVFVASFLFWRYTTLLGLTVDNLLSDLQQSNAPVQAALLTMIQYGKAHPEQAGKSWPTLLKSQTFFNHVIDFEQKQHETETQAQAISG